LRCPRSHCRIASSEASVDLFRCDANLRILDIEELKSVPFAPRPHPFIERPIGALPSEYLDQTFFWNGLDLHRKLHRFATYYDLRRVHAGLSGRTLSSDAAYKLNRPDVR